MVGERTSHNRNLTSMSRWHYPPVGSTWRPKEHGGAGRSTHRPVWVGTKRRPHGPSIPLHVAAEAAAEAEAALSSHFATVGSRCVGRQGGRETAGRQHLEQPEGMEKKAIRRPAVCFCVSVFHGDVDAVRD